MKNIILISGLLLTAGFLFTKNKVKNVIADYESIFKQLKIKLAGIKNLNISNGQLTARVTLNITNPTTTNLGLDTNSYVTLKKLLFYTESGKYIGEALPNISNIQLPAQQTITSPEIPVIVPLNNNAINVGFELLTNSKNLQVKAEIEAFNTTYTI
ncbi:MAG: hypothetical protein COA88_13605 [Kordia sp.]|nr:MAG: hypothetical protein COA88_13605 [Kordia sp.]